VKKGIISLLISVWEGNQEEPLSPRQQLSAHELSAELLKTAVEQGYLESVPEGYRGQFTLENGNYQLGGKPMQQLLFLFLIAASQE